RLERVEVLALLPLDVEPDVHELGGGAERGDVALLRGLGSAGRPRTGGEGGGAGEQRDRDSTMKTIRAHVILRGRDAERMTSKIRAGRELPLGGGFRHAGNGPCHPPRTTAAGGEDSFE